MTQSVLILGRQPALGIAEAESLFGADTIKPLGSQAVLVDSAPSELPFVRLGGSTRLAKLLAYLPYTDWEKIEQYLASELPKHADYLPEGKVKLGISVYGLKVNVRRLNASGLEFKKSIKQAGRSVRVVPNKDLELNTAQVIHNQLTGELGMELLLIRDGDRTALAQTVEVQDIEAYAARDQTRPARDARVGMLPPKLAQLIINLAVGKINKGEGSRAKGEVSAILDPFCGTGVVLQEALLMGYDVYGSDLEPRMVEYTGENLDWLDTQYDLSGRTMQIEQGDATSHQWSFSALTPQPSTFTIAGETYLGRPFSSEPKPEILASVMQDVDTIHRKFLENVAKQTKPGFKMTIAVPAWFTKKGVKHLKTLDNLADLGYNRLSFAHAASADLIYHRENQVVGRELVTLIRK